jgi:NAD(P)-dependent dehydrogenase (short-subunit alcohol dehydrogenase family)
MGIVLITGASRGLGLALTEEFASKGFTVVACARDCAAASLTALQQSYDGRVLPVTLDVVSDESVELAASRVASLVPHVDILINNAAIHAPHSQAALEELNVGVCLEVYNVNTLGPLRVTKAFLGLLEKGQTKNLVNISSEAGSISASRRETEFDYTMSKAALNMQSKTLQNYLKGRGIKVLAVHPGWVRTDMGGARAHFAPKESAGFVISLIERFGGDLNGPIYLNFDGTVLEY